MGEGRRKEDRRGLSKRRKTLRRLRNQRSGQDRRYGPSFGEIKKENRTTSRRLAERRGEDRRVVQTF